jgi:hypothetical protein
MITRTKAAVLILGVAVVLILVVVSGLYVAHRGEAESPTLEEHQAEQSLNHQLRLNPDLRARYAVHVRMMDLFDRFPTFDRANFGPTVRVVYWRSVKWTIREIFTAPDGSQIVRLSYGGGPGVDQEYSARLINGRYEGDIKFDWRSVERDPRFAGDTTPETSLPLSCRDVRSSGSPFAAVPASPGGPTITRIELSKATDGISDYPGTSLACYRFAGMTIVEFAHESTGVLFLLSRGRLAPLVRGRIAYMDAHGRYLVDSVPAGYNADSFQQTDYLEAFASR